MRRAPFAVIVLLLSPTVFAGTADAPEVNDAAGDVATSGGTPLQPLLDAAGQGDAFDDVDLLAAWFADDGTNVTLTLRSAAPVADDTVTRATFRVEQGPGSEWGSTADSAGVQLALRGATVDTGPDGTTVTTSDADLVIILPRDALGAVGGDVLGDLTVERSRSVDGVAGVAPGQEAEDRAPDEGAGAAYTLTRPPVVPGVRLEVIEIRVEEGASTRHLPGGDFTTADPDADITVVLRITNTGTDADTVEVTATASDGEPVVDNATFPLAPGAGGTAAVRLHLGTGGEAVVDLSLGVVSGRGAVAAEAIRITVAPLPPIDAPADEGDEGVAVEPVEGRLSWLTPAAEALGLDAAFGGQAEPVLLGLLAFLAVLLAGALWWLLGRGRRPSRQDSTEGTDALGHPGALGVLLGEGGPLGEVSVPGVRLQEVGHAPSDPRPGDDVTTTLVLRNGSPQGVRARVRMEVDGYAVLDQVVALLVRGRVRLRVPWTAGDGANHVHVEVLPA